MSRRYHLTLTEQQQQELIGMRDHDALAYLRVKAAGILKVAQGEPLQAVAGFQLLKPIDPDTLKSWCVRYLQDGRAGLLVQHGRGRKPAFFPCPS